MILRSLSIVATPCVYYREIVSIFLCIYSYMYTHPHSNSRVPWGSATLRCVRTSRPKKSCSDDFFVLSFLYISFEQFVVCFFFLDLRVPFGAHKHSIFWRNTQKMVHLFFPLRNTPDREFCKTQMCMSHVTHRTSRVTHLNEAWHTYERGMAHI